MKRRSTFGVVLAALFLAMSWSAALCETSCVLPRDAHGCCATHIDGGKSRLAQQPACEHAVRTVATLPLLPAAETPVIATARVIAPVLFAAGSVSRNLSETASPPKFNLRI
ncbi:MAG TPA: hypothetical protein VK729_15035 [Silvibacterium sp.]|nr:hypothetical protein [Silvibacterium sp.]